MFYFPAEYFLQVYSLPLSAEVRLQKDSFSEYPQQIRVGSGRTAVSYTRKSGYYAIHYNQASTVPANAILQLKKLRSQFFQANPINQQRVY
ncbi:hypothetical protein [Nostoc sp.]|uniref:hypothetical protein n=1 Tax=Nostoc sp. TaxID=1180 RepID=UPI002FF6E4FF